MSNCFIFSVTITLFVLFTSSNGQIPFICEEDGFFLNEYDCNSFWSCKNGEAILQFCPDDLQFVSDLQVIRNLQNYLN